MGMHENELTLSVELERESLREQAPGLIGCLRYYRDTNPVMSLTACTTLTVLLNAS